MFPLAFSADHERVIAILQDAVLSGGRLSVAMPRGSGKSTIALGAIIWMLVYGHRKFPVVVAATAAMAKEAVADIMQLMEDSTLLADDFPEVMYPINQLKGAHQKGSGQLYRGKAHSCSMAR